MFHHELIFVGDVHGQYAKLEQLLAHIKAQGNADVPLVFLGDLIDNKPSVATQHLKVLRRVKRLVDQGKAYCVMGNHELNAIGFATYRKDNEKPLRPHTPHNIRQHEAFLSAVGQNTERHDYWINWFKTLPLYLDFGDIRAIHACWNKDYIQAVQPYLNGDKSFKSSAWLSMFEEGHMLCTMLSTLLKGPEIALPQGIFFKDKTGAQRNHIRQKWWCSSSRSLRDLAQVQQGASSSIPDIPVGIDVSHLAIDTPVVIGHYTLHGEPNPLSDNVVCVDYGAASQENPLCAYHWKGERFFTKAHFLSSADELELAESTL